MQPGLSYWEPRNPNEINDETLSRLFSVTASKCFVLYEKLEKSLFSMIYQRGMD
jgi:hypothetical protein